METKKKILLTALVLCLTVAAILGTALVAHAEVPEKNGTFNGSPAHVDENGKLYVDETNFPDANFREYVMDKIDSDGDGMLSKNEADDVEFIFCNEMGILDLSGIEFFTSLGWLNCSRNSLYKLDLSANTNLYRLSCGENNLAELNVSANTRLSELYCWNNNLTELDLSKNSNLFVVNCGKNKIRTLDITACRYLDELYCSDNELTEIIYNGSPHFTGSFRGVFAFSVLELSGNHIIECSKLTFFSMEEGKFLHDADIIYSETALTSLYSVKTSKGWEVDLTDLVGEDGIKFVTNVFAGDNNEIEGKYDLETGIATFADNPESITYYFALNDDYTTVDQNGKLVWKPEYVYRLEVAVDIVCIHNDDDSIIETVGQKSATCTEKGYTGDKVCSVCGTIIETGEEIDMIPHNYQNGKCVVCGETDPNYTEPPTTEPDPPVTEPESPVTEPDPSATEKPPVADNADTGDNTDTRVWFIILTVSIMGVAVSAYLCADTKRRTSR